MEIEFTLKARDDVKYWKKAGDKVIQKRIDKLLANVLETPYEGIGKPEQLKYEWVGYWSRRINREHRLVYEVLPEKILVHSLKEHYE